MRNLLIPSVFKMLMRLSTCSEALGHVTIELMDMEDNYIVKTSATHEDIVMSSVLALLKGFNRIMKFKNS